MVLIPPLLLQRDPRIQEGYDIHRTTGHIKELLMTGSIGMMMMMNIQYMCSHILCFIGKVQEAVHLITDWTTGG